MTKYDELFSLPDTIATQGEEFEVKVNADGSILDKSVVLSLCRYGDYNNSLNIDAKKEHVPAIVLHMDGTQGSTTFTDINPFRDWTGEGNAEIDTTIKKFGTGSAHFEISSDYIYDVEEVGLVIGGSNFKSEFWVYFAEVPVSGLFWGIEGFVDCGYSSTEDTIYIAMPLGGASCTFSPEIETWYHLVFERIDLTIKIFIDGVYTSTSTYGNTNAVISNDDTIFVGKPGSELYIDDFVFTIGFANRREDFDVPISAYASYPTSAYIVVDDELSTQWNGKYIAQVAVGNSCRKTMLHFEKNVVDESGRYWVGIIGIFDTDIFKFGTSSLYLADDGIFSVQNVEIGYNDFCVDFWIRFDTTDVYDHSIFYGYNDDTGDLAAIYIDDGLLVIDLETSYGSLGFYCDFVYDEDEWYHIALGRYSGEGMIFINGVSQTIVPSSYSFVDENPFIPEFLFISIDATDFSFFIDEFRFMVGTNPYITDFTPPTEAYGMDTKVYGDVNKANGVGICFPAGS